MKCILIASAGTGGHIFPAIALAKELKRLQPDVRVAFIRAGRERFDENSASGLGEIHWVPGMGMPRKLSLKLPAFVVQTLRSVTRSFRLVKELRPDVVVGFGNFGSYGPVKAAARRRIPVFLHEGNIIPGKANRILGRHAAAIGTNFPVESSWFPGKALEIVGMPVRDDFKTPPDRAAALKYFGLDPGKPVLLVTGGSQGAHHINETVVGMIPAMKDLGIQVIHLTGSADFPEVSSAYEDSGIGSSVKAFEERMKLAFDAADVVISRAGASSIAEITLTGKPAILVPYPYATDNHQLRNAEYMARANAAVLIEDNNMTIGNLFEKLESLIRDEKKRRSLSDNCARLAIPDSAGRMAETVMRLAETSLRK